MAEPERLAIVEYGPPSTFDDTVCPVPRWLTLDGSVQLNCSDGGELTWAAGRPVGERRADVLCGDRPGRLDDVCAAERGGDTEHHAPPLPGAHCQPLGPTIA